LLARDHPAPVRIAGLLVAACMLNSMAATPISSNEFRACIDTVPSWIVQFEQPAFTAAQRADGRTVVIPLAEKQVNLALPRRAVYRRFVQVPLSSEGVNSVSEISIPYNPQYQELTVHYVRVTRGSDTLDKLLPREIRLIQREQNLEQQMYDGQVSASMVLRDIRVGDQVEFAYTIVGSNPVFGDKYSDEAFLGWTAEVKRSVFRVVAPEKRRFETKTFNGELTPKITTRGGLREYLWVADNIKSVATETGVPSWYNPFLYVEISEFANWSDVVSWARGLYPDKAPLGTELEKNIANWKSAGDEATWVRRALQFVQDEVRYFGIEIGENSHRPTPPADVMQRRYGDCKDKAYLLSLILRRMGLRAWPALVSFEHQGTVGDKLPTPLAFDHVIVRAVVGKNIYWLDPTRTYQRGALDLLGCAQFEKALVIADTARQLTPVALPARYVCSIESQETFSATHYDSAVVLVARTRYRGSMAEYQRGAFANSSVDEQRKSCLGYYLKRFPDVAWISGPTLQDDPDSNLLVIDESYRLPRFWKKEPPLIIAEVADAAISPFVAMPHDLNRSMPYELVYPLHVSHESVLKYPENVSLSINPADSTVLENTAVRFSRSSVYADSVCRIKFTYVARKSAVPPGEFGDYLETLRKIQEELSWTLRTPYNRKGSASHLTDSLTRMLKAVEDGISPLALPEPVGVVPAALHAWADSVDTALSRRDKGFLLAHLAVDSAMVSLFPLPLAEKSSGSDSTAVAIRQSYAFRDSALRVVRQTFVKQLLSCFSAGNHAWPSRCRSVEDGWRMLLRIDYPEGGTGYVELSIKLTGDSTFAISDCLNYVTGVGLVETIESVRRQVGGVFPHFPPELARRQHDAAARVCEVLTLVAKAEYAEASRALILCSEEQLRLPSIVAARIAIAKNAGPDAYRAMLAWIAAEFGPDSRYSLVLVDYYIKNCDWPRAHAAIDALIKRSGGDPKQYAFHAGVEKLAGRPLAAVHYYRRAIELFPEYRDAYWGLLDVLVGTGHYQEGLLTLDVLASRFGVTVDSKALSGVKGYRRFVSSRAYRRWDRSRARLN